MLGEPVLDEQPKEEGSVRIKIVVDAFGNVTSAIAVYQSALTTLTDSKHIELAKRAAQTAKFEPNSLHPRRTGYITIRFDLE